MCLCLPAIFKLDQVVSRVALRPGMLRVRAGILQDLRVWPGCRTSVWELYVCTEHQARTASKSGTHGSGIEAGMLSGQKRP